MDTSASAIAMLTTPATVKDALSFASLALIGFEMLVSLAGTRPVSGTTARRDAHDCPGD